MVILMCVVSGLDEVAMARVPVKVDSEQPLIDMVDGDGVYLMAQPGLDGAELANNAGEFLHDVMPQQTETLEGLAMASVMHAVEACNEALDMWLLSGFDADGSMDYRDPHTGICGCPTCLPA